MAELAVGIDLGTTFSVISCLDSTGRPQTIRNLEGDLTTPSVVLFEPNSAGEIDKDPVVGREAVNAAAFMPDCIADMAKRDMGSSEYSRQVARQTWRPEVLQAYILEKLKRDAEASGHGFRRAVITVPAYFDNARRERTIEAAKLAGIEVLAIINEPTAAALVYGVQQGFLTDGSADKREVVLVYDLGGGTFDATVMEIVGREYRVLATDGDVELGGKDWDRRVVDYIAEQFKAANRGRDPRDDPRGLARLERDAEQAKRSLSSLETTMVMFEHGGNGARIPLSRAQFEEMTSDLLERTIFTSGKVIRDARLNWSDVSRILLVGGSTKMPGVERRLKEESGISPSRVLAADEAVAHGAALYAGILLARKGIREILPGQAPLQQMVVRDITSHDLGMMAIDPATGEQRISVIIPRRTPLPAAQRKTFYTRQENQRAIRLTVTEGRNEIWQETVRLPSPEGGLVRKSPVNVTYQYDLNGCLTVIVQVPMANASEWAQSLRVFRPAEP